MVNIAYLTVLTPQEIMGSSAVAVVGFPLFCCTLQRFYYPELIALTCIPSAIFFN